MTKGTRIDWNGKEVAAKMLKAQILGINVIMSRAVLLAKKNHDWQNRTGTLENSIRVVSFGRAADRGATGLWGSRDVVYALAQEFGNYGPYLRSAADEKYPELAAQIKKALDK